MHEHHDAGLDRRMLRQHQRAGQPVAAGGHRDRFGDEAKVVDENDPAERQQEQHHAAQPYFAHVASPQRLSINTQSA